MGISALDRLLKRNNSNNIRYLLAATKPTDIQAANALKYLKEISLILLEKLQIVKFESMEKIYSPPIHKFRHSCIVLKVSLLKKYSYTCGLLNFDFKEIAYTINFYKTQFKNCYLKPAVTWHNVLPKCQCIFIY